MARKESDTEEVRAKLKDVNSEYYYHKDYQLGATENDENFRKALGNYLGLLPRPRDANRKFLDKRRAEGLSELQVFLMRCNQLSGPLIDFTRLTKLRNVWFDTNQLTGSLVVASLEEEDRRGGLGELARDGRADAAAADDGNIVRPVCVGRRVASLRSRAGAGGDVLVAATRNVEGLLAILDGRPVAGHVCADLYSIERAHCVIRD